MDYPVRVPDPIPFERTHRLGAGATGEVWYAEAEGRRLAVKIAAGGRSLAAEVGALARVRHPNIPVLVAADRSATWMARAYVEGARLTSWAHERRLADRIQLMQRVAETMVAVHAAGVLHGDLSPANILVDEHGQPHLLDLGADTRGGSLGWMAPERLRGEGPSELSDVYGLGALLYAVCTGRPPYARTGAQALGYAQGATLPVPVGSLAPEVPADVAELALAALAHRPSSRPPSAAAFVEALRHAGPQLPSRVVVGMDDERDRLRRILVDVLRGESALVIVHGAPGSGRRTLVDEVAHRATVEGLAVQRMRLEEAGRALNGAQENDVIVLDADGLDVQVLRAALEPPTDAGLVIVRASVPVRALASRGLVHIRPAAFGRSDVALLSAALGHGSDRAESAYERSRGHPAVAVALLQGHVAVPELTPPQARLLGRLEEGSARLPELAGLVELTEHQTLDALEPLFEAGVVWSGPDGAELYASRTI